MTCNGCGQPKDGPRPWNCPEYHAPPHERTRRTPEAQADIAAARAAPRDDERKQRLVCRLCGCRWTGSLDLPCPEQHKHPRQSHTEIDATEPTGDVGPAEVVGLETVLSNAAIADTPAVRQWCSKPEHDAGCVPPCAAAPSDTPAVREMGGPTDPLSKPACKACECFAWEVDNGKALILRGDDLARYQALCDAARNAQDTARAAKTAAGALMGAFQALCAGVAPAKEP